ncbi:MAG: class I SAM-dependent methyltransferase [Rhodospirillales bacterium]|nr:class I SAM-dependent methyltransferase [Rhodospirillales bacterium]
MIDDVLYEGRDLEALAEIPRYYDWIISCFSKHLSGDFLEIGAGAGAVSEKLLPWAQALDLVEPSPNLVARLEERFAGEKKVRVHSMSMERFLKHKPAKRFDVVVMVNVLEHIEDDRAALEGLLAVLKPGGHILLFVPALPFLYSELDRLVGHYRRYRRSAMVRLMEDAGFQVILSRYMDILGIIPWWFTFTLGRKTTFNKRAVGIYDLVGVRVTRMIERLFGAPVGKSIVAVGRKPD